MNRPPGRRPGPDVPRQEPSEAAIQCRRAAISLSLLGLLMVIGGLSILAIGKGAFAEHDEAYGIGTGVQLLFGIHACAFGATVWKGRKIDYVLALLVILVVFLLLLAVYVTASLPFEWPLFVLTVLFWVSTGAAVVCVVDLSRTYAAMVRSRRTWGRE